MILHRFLLLICFFLGGGGSFFLFCSCFVNRIIYSYSRFRLYIVETDGFCRYFMYLKPNRDVCIMKLIVLSISMPPIIDRHQLNSTLSNPILLPHPLKIKLPCIVVLITDRAPVLIPLPTKKRRKKTYQTPNNTTAAVTATATLKTPFRITHY